MGDIIFNDVHRMIQCGASRNTNAGAILTIVNFNCFYIPMKRFYEIKRKYLGQTGLLVFVYRLGTDLKPNLQSMGVNW